MSAIQKYPGYRADPCNGCGLCCLTTPCILSNSLGLWRNGACVALRRTTDRYVCDAIVNPRRVSVKLSKLSKKKRLFALGAGMGCDHRAAWSLEQALELLKVRSITDDLLENAGDTYPRACIWHRDDGKTWQVVMLTPGGEPLLGPVDPLRPGWNGLKRLDNWRREQELEGVTA